MEEEIKLTRKLINKLDEIIEKWMNHFEKMEFDEEKARELIDFIYATSGFKEPKIIICEGPNSIKESFRRYLIQNSPFEENIRDSDEILERRHGDIRFFNSNFAFTQLFTLGKEAYPFLSHERIFFHSHHLKSTLDKLKNYLGEDMQDVIKEVIFCDYFNEIGLIKDNRAIEYLLKIKGLIKCHIYSMVCLREVCFISKPPVFVKLNDNNELHSAEGPAIYFSDKTSFYYIYGVPFREGDYNSYVKGNPTGRKILSIKNLEQKAVLIKLFGYERIMADLEELKLLDKYDKISQITGKKTTCQLFEFQMDLTILRVLKVEDHSVHKVTFLGVPRTNQTSTCLGAIAWTFRLKTENYRPMMES